METIKKEGPSFGGSDSESQGLVLSSCIFNKATN